MHTEFNSLGRKVFEEMRQLAEKSGAKVHKWSQSESGAGSVCSTIVSRWIKYQLLGKGDQFWTKIERGQSDGYLKKIEKIKAKHTEDQVNRSAAQAKYAAYVRDEADYQQNRGAIPPFPVVKPPPIGEQMAQLVDGSRALKDKERYLYKEHGKLKLNSTGKKPLLSGEEALGHRVTAPREGAIFVGLQKLQGDLASGHSLGTFQHVDGRVSFFDPNLGEVTFSDTKSYTEWMVAYQAAWAKDDLYGRYKSWQSTTMNGWADARHKGREAASLRKKVLELEEEQATVEALQEEQATQDWSKQETFEINFGAVSNDDAELAMLLEMSEDATGGFNSSETN